MRHAALPPTGIAVRGAAAAVAGWMAVFAAVHAYWLLGGGLGLPGGESIYSRPALVVIDAFAVPLCIGGVLLARSLRWPADRRPFSTATPR